MPATLRKVLGFFFWKYDRPPTWREYPGVLLRVTLFGALIGPLWGSVSNLLFSRPLSEAFHPIGMFLVLSAYAGAAMTLSFYSSCRLPWLYIGTSIRQYPPAIRWGLVAAIGATGGMCGFTIAMLLCSPIPGLHIFGMHRFWVLLLSEAAVGAILAMLIGSFRTLRAQVREAEAKIHEKELRESALAESAAKAQATALQSQINPHFFFNTLNTLSALIPMDQEAALEVVGRLADMFRYTLACSQAQKVTLAEELDFVNNYLKLEQARFSRRLSVTMPEGEFHDIILPGLSLQPLVENAIRHGIAKRIEGGNVEISVHRNGKSCSVDVFSPSNGEPAPARFFREGHALANVRDRLQIHAGSAAGVDIGGDGLNRVRVSLVLPL